MAQPTIDEAAAALAAVITAGTGLRCKPYVDTTVNAPEAHIFTRPFDPRMVQGGSPKRVFLFTVRVYVPAVDARVAQSSLRKYMEPSGSTSIRQAIEDETAWNVDVDYAEVTEIGQPTQVELPSNETYWAVDIDADVVW